MLDHKEREALRRRALAQWAEADRLAAVAHDLVDTAADLRREAKDVARRARTIRWVNASARIDRTLVEASTATRAWTEAGAVGLVCSADPPLILGLREDRATGCSRIVGAQDGAVAIALAIAAQPDVGVVEDDLPLLDGIDVLHGMRAYAPRSSLIMLTSDPKVETSARALGARTLRRDAPRATIAQAMRELTA